MEVTVANFKELLIYQENIKTPPLKVNIRETGLAVETRTRNHQNTRQHC
jgi:hypothetical protein